LPWCGIFLKPFNTFANKQEEDNYKPTFYIRGGQLKDKEKEKKDQTWNAYFHVYGNPEHQTIGWAVKTGAILSAKKWRVRTCSSKLVRRCKNVRKRVQPTPLLSTKKHLPLQVRQEWRREEKRGFFSVRVLSSFLIDRPTGVWRN
jgi:hypothetical protein